MKKNKTIKDSIASHDFFGHEVNLNFARRGSVHKTWVGGLCSIFIKILFFIYVASFTYRCLWYKDNNELFYTE